MKILYIEPDELLRSAAHHIFEDHAHKLLVAANLFEANRILHGSAREIDAIVIDPYVADAQGKLIPLSEGAAAYEPGLRWIETLVARDPDWEEKLILAPTLAAAVDTDTPLFDRMSQNGQIVEKGRGFTERVMTRLAQMNSGMSPP